MWNRIRRIFRSIVGAFIELGEDPELILKQNIRDLQDQVPKMNEHIAMVKANATLLQNEKNKLTSKIPKIKARIKASLSAKRRDLALNYATTLEQIQEDLAATEQQLTIADLAYEKALRIKKAFMAEKDRKTKEAMRAIRDIKRAGWQKKVADAMETFEVAGIDQTHDEMIRKIDEKAAQSQARMEMALDNIDAQGIEIEEEARKLEANELLKQFELEMGIQPPQTVDEADKTIGPSGIEEEDKTIGPADKTVLE